MVKKMNNIQLFFDEPNREVAVREYARLQVIAPATAAKQLSKLLADGLLIRHSERRMLLYRAATQSDAYKDAKVAANIRRIRESGLLEHLESQLHPLAIFLFGSHAKAENQKGSDIDLFVLARTKKAIDTERFAKFLKAPVQLFMHAPEELKGINPHLLNNIINGIRLAGFWEVF